jgi:hypothetical protein
MVSSEDVSVWRMIANRLEQEKEKTLKAFLQPNADVAELRGLHRGLELAWMKIKTEIMEMEKDDG